MIKPFQVTFIIDTPVTVHVGFVHQSVALLLSHPLPEVHHDVPQLYTVDKSVAILDD